MLGWAGTRSLCRLGPGGAHRLGEKPVQTVAVGLGLPRQGQPGSWLCGVGVQVTAELPRASAVRLASLRDLPAQLLELYQQGFSLVALHPFVQPTHEREKTPLEHIFRAILIKKADRSQNPDLHNEGYILELDCCSSLDHLTDQKIIPEFIKKITAGLTRCLVAISGRKQPAEWTDTQMPCVCSACGAEFPEDCKEDRVIRNEESTRSSSNDFAFFGASWESVWMFRKHFKVCRVMAHVFWLVLHSISVPGATLAVMSPF
ncbi:hypothetical protein J1605_021236 [Eschrichtius robustus]|uniref:Raftlin n=1 Tax=Eschrichtius robustus TaxID=9764 RepID=A0AB34HFD4_ESCRO|nr:hypothetical protein J1605_021236 [Eschrichtius robustus]